MAAILRAMDPVRFGLAVRALRHRRGWTQAQLAARSGVSQSAISRIERGGGYRLTVAVLTGVAGMLGARISLRLLSHGEDVDRLLDARHARIVEWIASLLRRAGWEVVPEATFSIYGERGSIDILAYHPATGSLLVIEVNSAVPDVHATLAGIDRKAAGDPDRERARLAGALRVEVAGPAGRQDVAAADRAPRRDVRRRAPGTHP